MGTSLEHIFHIWYCAILICWKVHVPYYLFLKIWKLKLWKFPFPNWACANWTFPSWKCSNWKITNWKLPNWKCRNWKFGNPQHPSTYRLPPLHPTTFLGDTINSMESRSSGPSRKASVRLHKGGLPSAASFRGTVLWVCCYVAMWLFGHVVM